MRFNSKHYWESRYRSGGNSGVGSYGKLAINKSNFISSFIKDYNIKSMIEFGCGDGNNLQIISSNNPELEVVGVDVSATALQMCKLKMPQHTFVHKDNYDHSTKDLVVSLDVLYHLIEDEVYEDYLTSLTKISSPYLLIYSPDFDNSKYEPHVRARKFTNNPLLLKKYNFFKKYDNEYSIHKYKDGSFSDWYLFILKQ